MWIADRWKDYRVLDTSDGEKLEDWGGYRLIRPDPQVLWSKEKKPGCWRHPNAHYHRSDKGGGSWEFFDLPETWDIHYDLDALVQHDNRHSPKDQTSYGNAAGSAYANANANVNASTNATANAYANVNATANADTNANVAEILSQYRHMRRMTFHLKPFAFKHTGVFPEQAVNWDFSYRMISERISGWKLSDNGASADSTSTSYTSGLPIGTNALADSGLSDNANSSRNGRKVKVLNLFAYTGGATLAAALAGAHVTHVDASKGMVNWARENAAASGLSSAPIRWLVDDCVKFVEREIRRGSKYDVIIMDPPSYGRGPKGEIWKIEESIYPFIRLCTELLSDDPLFLLINSYTTGLQAGVLTYMLELSLKGRFRGHAESSELGLPVADGSLILPEGASGRFIFD